MMSNIREKCEGCGMCCRAIFIPIKHSEITTDIDKMKANRFQVPITFEPGYTISENMDDRTFIIQNWYPLTKEEALQRNPHLESWTSGLESGGHDFDEILSSQFYGCSQLNEQTGRCNVHDNQPRVCSGYPWYGKEPSINHQFYADDCYYKRDLTGK